MAELVNKVFTSEVDSLVAGAIPAIIKGGVTIVSGAGKLARGTVLGRITASGKFTKCDSTATDGSQIANCILYEDVDATSADVNAEVYKAGMYNRDALIWGGTDTYATGAHEDELRTRDIYLTSIIAD